MKIKLMYGDCLERMKNIPDNSIDMVLTDPPYGTTACKWDTVIPFEPMWEQLRRITKPAGAIVLFSKQPFTSKLIMSRPDMFKQPLIWIKDNHDNPLMAKKRFLNITEDINVFCSKQSKYYPQGIRRVDKMTKQGAIGRKNSNQNLSQASERGSIYRQEFTGYPRNVLRFKRDLTRLHRTQKPVALLEYLVKTYTLEGETVLDFTMGSGSTGVACKNLNRNFIGIEKDKEYFRVAKQRIKDA